MKKQTKIAAGEKEDPGTQVPEVGDVGPEAAPAEAVPVTHAAPAPTEQAAMPAAPAQPVGQPNQGATSFANFEAMKSAVEEADRAIKQNPEAASRIYSVDTTTDPPSFTLKIKPAQKVAPKASLQRPTKKASKILAEAFPAEWLKAMGL